MAAKSPAPPLASVELMHPSDSAPFSRAGWLFELKYDGYRVLASKAQLITRNGKDASTWYPEVLTALTKLRGDFILDGEVCLLDNRGIPQFERMRGRARSKRGGDPVTYFAFDLLWLNGKDLRTLPLIERKAKLKKLIGADSPRLRYVDYIESAGEAMFKHAVAMGIEGVMAKRADSIYKAGRSREWLRFKQADWHEGFERPKQRAP